MDLKQTLENLNRIKKSVNNIKSTDLPHGQLGLAVSHLYFGALNDNDETYDFGYDILIRLFDKVKNDDYVNSNYELPILGYVLESLKRNDILDIDTDAILEETDSFLINRSLAVKFSGHNYFQSIAICYYLASRTDATKVNSSNFMIIQMLILNLIDIITGLDAIVADFQAKTESKGYFIELFFNILSLARFLENQNVCKGFGENLAAKISMINFDQVNKRNLSVYHNYLLSIVLSVDNRENIIERVISSTFKTLTSLDKVSTSQMFSLILMVRRSRFGSSGIKEEYEKELIKFIATYFDAYRQNDGSLNGYFNPGIIGLSVFPLLTSGGKNCFYDDIVNILPLFNISSFPFATN